MQSSPTWPVQSPNLDLQPLVFSFFPNGASAVSQATLAGYVTSVTRTGAGTFACVIPDQGIFVAADARLRFVTGGDQTLEAKAGTWVSATRTLTVNVSDINTGAGTGAAADVAANADNQILVTMWFRGQ